MTDQLNGLRFDIYERVHLPDDVAAIEELEEIELVPHMQALPQDDQVLLRGHLLLSGIYRSQESTGVKQLEHWIPVEISLPLNRIQSVEQLAVEIDNFDVDLLTTRSLNVTGVLALRGLQVQAPQVPIWRDDSFTVVHQAESGLGEESESLQLNSEESERDVTESPPAEEDSTSTMDAELDAQDQVDDWNLQSETEEPLNEASKESNWLSMFQNLEGTSRNQDSGESSEALANAQNADSSWGDVTNQSPEEREQVMPVPEALIEEKPDVKVALGGKALESVERLQSGVGLLSQLGDHGAKREAELKLLEVAQAEEQALEASKAASSSGDELEWTKLFISNEAHSFRKVKMCIIQREETLELIATRYNVQPRELQLYNRLNEPYLSEGQVLYIP